MNRISGTSTDLVRVAIKTESGGRFAWSRERKDRRQAMNCATSALAGPIRATDRRICVGGRDKERPVGCD